MRRTALMLGVLGAITTLAGCGGSTQAPSTSSPVTIKLLATNTYKTAIEATVAAFEKQNKQITVEVSFTSDATISTTLPLELAAGNAADVVSIFPGTYGNNASGTLAQRGFLLDLSKEPWAKGLPARLDAFAKYKGKVYYPPLVSLPILTMYNQTALKQHGLQAPTSWSEVLTFCKAAKAAGVTAYALGAQTQSQNQMLPFNLVPTLVDRVNPSFMTDRANGKATFANSGWVDVFQRMKDMNDTGCFNQPLGTDVSAAQDAVARGTAMGMFGPSPYFGIIQQKLGSTGTLQAAAFPGTSNPADTWMAISLGSSYGVNAKTQHPAEAKAFIDFLMQPNNVVAYADASGQLPALPASRFTPGPATELAVQYMNKNKTAPVPDQLFPSPTIRTAWIVTTQKMLGGQASAQDVARAMDKAWDSASGS